MHIKWSLFMLLNELHCCRYGPFRIVALKGGLGVVPVNILGPGEPEILHCFPVALFILILLTIERFCKRGILFNLM